MQLRGIEHFKILNVNENIYRIMFSSVKEDTKTRGHYITLAKKQCKRYIRKLEQEMSETDDLLIVRVLVV